MLSRIAYLLDRRWRLFLFLLLPLLSLFMHWRVFNMELVGVHVWRQTQTQENIDNFVHEDFNILNPRLNNHGTETSVQRMEFPLMQWTFACFYRIYGDHLIISRILTFIIGLFAAWGMFFLANALSFERLTGLAAAWCFSFSPLFYYYTMNPLPDNLALCAAIWGLVYVFRWRSGGRMRILFFAAFWLMIATLCKLPFIVFFIVPALALFAKLRSDGIKSVIKPALVVLLIASPALAWYAWVIPGWEGNGVLTGVLGNDKTDNALQHLWGNLSSTLPELLLNYGSCLFFVYGLFAIFRRGMLRRPEVRWCAAASALVIAYFLFELNMIGTTHDYYMFPFLPLLFLIVVFGLREFFRMKNAQIKNVSVLLLCLLPVTAFLRIDSRWDYEHPGFNRDLLYYKNELRKAVPDSALCIEGNDFSQRIMFYYTGKKGWAFMNDEADANWIKARAGEGARYIYCDSEKVLKKPGVDSVLGKKIGQFGTIGVYELRK